jgi:transglutaminase-like putative cysteine protease
VLFVALARAAGLPARIDVGLVYVHGAFYYHAWPEVFLAAGKTKASAAETVATGHWMAVDPTLNQFPADSTHLRLLRGGLERQAAILPLIGVLKMTVLDVQFKPESERILVGGPAARTSQSDAALDTDLAVLDAVPAPTTTSRRCWCFGFGGSK